MKGSGRGHRYHAIECYGVRRTVSVCDLSVNIMPKLDTLDEMEQIILESHKVCKPTHEIHRKS